ncbi:MAG: TonB family protein [Pseudomonadota bacterium]
MLRSVVIVTTAVLSAAVATAAPNGLPTPPKPTVITSPEYPKRAFRDRIEGDVEVCFRILANGRVYRPYVSSSTHRIFNRSAIRAIKSSTFEPESVKTAFDKACRKYQFRLKPVENGAPTA